MIGFNGIGYKQTNLFYYIGYFLIALIIIFFLVYLATDLKFVGKVEIEGNLYLSNEEILEITGIKKDQLFLTLTESKLKMFLENNQIIEEATVEKKFPNRVVNTIREHKVVGCFSYNEQVYQLYSNGYHFNLDNLSSCKGPIISGIDDYFYNELLHDYAIQFGKIDSVIRGQFSEVIYLPDQFDQEKMTAYMNDGNQVKFTIQTMSYKFNYYDQMKYELFLQYGYNINGIFDFEVGTFFTPYRNP